MQCRLRHKQSVALLQSQLTSYASFILFRLLRILPLDNAAPIADTLYKIHCTDRTLRIVSGATAVSTLLYTHVATL
jgi:hypothetical protein